MNANTSTTRSALRATASAACLLSLFAGATACGTDHGTASTPKSHGRPAAQPGSAGWSTVDLVERAKAMATRHQSSGPHGYGDDRRQEHAESSRGQLMAHHSPGFDKALPGSW